MMPGVNPKQLSKMMKQMGVQQDEISAKEVIIRTDEGDIIIKNPSVQKVNMMGQVSYQISGEEIKASASVNEDDIQMVMSAAGVSREFAEAALEDANGDIAKAILLLKEQ
jgi:nascent polypeptide-associated complex subunit alpha